MPAKTAAKPAAKAAGKKAAAKPAAKASGKAAGKAGAKVAAKVAIAPISKTDPRCVSTKKSFHLGGDIVPKGAVDLTRFTRWPQYVQRQRRVRILQSRLKTPPAIHQFSRTVDADLRKEIFRFAAKYTPESKKERAQRLKAVAAAKAAKGKDAPAVPPKKAALRTGLKSITRLIEHKRAKLVLIAHDVDPLELVMFLPALCKKQGVPFAIVKGKALLGKLTGFKQAAAVAFEKIRDEDSAAFKTILSSIATDYAEGFDAAKRTWGGLKLGRVSTDKLRILKEKERRAQKAMEAAIAGK